MRSQRYTSMARPLTCLSCAGREILSSTYRRHFFCRWVAGQQRKEGIRVHALRTKKYDQNQNTNARENETWCENDSGISSLRYFMKYDETSMFACYIRLFASMFCCVRTNGRSSCKFNDLHVTNHGCCFISHYDHILLQLF